MAEKSLQSCLRKAARNIRYDAEMETVVFEEHSSVLANWVERSLHRQTLICFDTHLDLQPISADRLAKLDAAQSAEEISRLAKPHHLYPDDGYSYGIEDFIFAAKHLEIIDHLIWVTPPHVDISDAATAINQLRQLDGVTVDDIMSLRRVASGQRSWITGNVLGLQLTIGKIADLPLMQLPPRCLIDIDIDYFVDVPAERLTSTPADLCAALNQTSVAIDCVTISRSVRSGFTPLRFRFLAEHLEAIFDQCDAKARHYNRLIDAHRLINDGSRADAREVLELELQHFEQCPATHHAMKIATENDALAAQHHRRAVANSAASISAEYADSPLRTATGLSARFCEFDQSDVNSIAARIKPDAGDIQACLSHAAIGMLNCLLENAPAAIAHYRAVTQAFTSGLPELALEIGKLLVETSPDAIDYFRVAKADDKTRTAATFFEGICQFKLGDFDAAETLLQEASSRAPAWPDPLRMLADINQVRGNFIRSQQYAQSLLEIESRITSAPVLSDPRQGAAEHAR